MNHFTRDEVVELFLAWKDTVYTGGGYDCSLFLAAILREKAFWKGGMVLI